MQQLDNGWKGQRKFMHRQNMQAVPKIDNNEAIYTWKIFSSVFKT